ncbi:hypothetical protein Tco_0791349 [Tanacetum coccineum]
MFTGVTVHAVLCISTIHQKKNYVLRVIVRGRLFMASSGSDRDAEYALSKLLQLGTIEDYQREFEKLMNWFMDIPDSLLISYFFSGLKLNLQHEFFVSRPTTLGDVFSLARIIEARFEDERTTTTIANPNDINIAVPDQVLEESTLHTSDKVEVVPTSMVATYDEHGESGDGEHDDAIVTRVVERMHLLITESTRLDQGEVFEGLQHEQGLLLFRGRYFIGAQSKLKEFLLSEFHDTPSAGHRGSKKKIKDEI